MSMQIDSSSDFVKKERKNTLFQENVGTQEIQQEGPIKNQLHASSQLSMQIESSSEFIKKEPKVPLHSQNVNQ